jgi:uncharacterized membrane protein YeiH
MRELTRYVTFSTLVLVLDLCGTFVFALSGAAAGIKLKFDLFGVLVLSFVAANFGGIMRDLLIGAVPPPGISDWRYIAVPAIAGLALFRWSAPLDRVHGAVQIFDAAGLGLFAVAGAEKALNFHLGPVPAVLLGMLTGIGGGLVRDVLSAEIPAIFRGDIYAVAALTGAAVVVVGRMLTLPSTAVTIAGAVICFTLRFVSLQRSWQLPIAGESPRWTAKPRPPRVKSNDDGARSRQ